MAGIGKDYEKKPKGERGFNMRSGNRSTFRMMGSSSPMKTDYLSDKKGYATEDYQAGVSHIQKAIEGGASRQDVRNLVQEHNKATIGKKYKKGAQSNALINVDRMLKGMSKTEVTDEPVMPSSGVETSMTKEDVLKMGEGSYEESSGDHLWEIFTDSSHEKGLKESSGGADVSYENVKASKAGEYEGLTGDALRKAMEKTNIRNVTVDTAESGPPYKKPAGFKMKGMNFGKGTNYKKK